MIDFDLHMHSNYSSDGELTPIQLVEMAHEKGLKTIALCDHDAVAGVPEMKEAAKQFDMRIIDAIECSTVFIDHDVHLLGYGIDIEDPYFKNLSAHTRKLSRAAFYQRVHKIQEKYEIEVDVEDVIERSNGENPWFLFFQEILENPKYQTIPDFQDYLPGGKRCDPAPVNFFWDRCQKGSDLYVYVANPSFEETINKIHQAGGIAIIAHPFRTFYQNETLIKKAIEAGIDGLEVYSTYHEKDHIAYYLEIAKKYDLLITCGSDFHGKKKPSIHMGEYGLDHDDEKYLETFLQAVKEHEKA